MRRSQRVCFRGVCSCLSAWPLESGRYMAGLTPSTIRSPKRAERPTGTRVALPGTFCETEVSQSLHGRHKTAPTKSKKLNAVRKHLPGLCQIGLVDQRE